MSSICPCFSCVCVPKNWTKNTTMKKIPSNPSEQPRAFCPLKNLQKSKRSVGTTESTPSIKPQQLHLELQTTLRTARNSPCFFDLFRCEWLNDLKYLKLTWKYYLYWNCIACSVTVDHPLAPKGVVEVDNQRKIAHRLVLTMSIDRLHTLKSIFSAWNK